MKPSLDRLLLCVLVVLFMGSLVMPADVEANGGARIAVGASPLDRVELLHMTPVDHQRLLAEDAANAGPGVPLRFATPRPVSVSPQTSGTWETLADGSRLWRLRVTAEGALSLNFGFGTYRMPAGGTLVLYTPDGSTMLGPYTEHDNRHHGQLWTPLLDGDEAVIEVHLDAARWRNLDLELRVVNLGYRRLELGEKSGACNIDVVCPEGADWGPQIRSVARIIVSGVSLCTGFLVNNTSGNFDPLFLTADHCGLSPGTSASLVVYWDYANSTCRTPGGAASGALGDGSLNLTQSGSTYLAGSNTSDFTLVRLDEMPPAAANAHWVGWDARPSQPNNVVTVHHPQGDEKRISFENDPVTISSYLGDASPGDGTHIRIADWDEGTTEGGSSGAPLYDPDGRAIGQLHGGFAACGNDLPDWYGRISTSWGLGLEEWLDPQSTGTMVMDGSDPGPSTCVTDSTTLCLNNGRFRVTVDIKTAAGDESQANVYTSFPADDFGLLWFFGPNNAEMLVKVLDGCAINNNYWVFAAAATNVEYTLTVTDTANDQTTTYLNPLGAAAEAITDTEAFATCP